MDVKGSPIAANPASPAPEEPEDPEKKQRKNLGNPDHWTSKPAKRGIGRQCTNPDDPDEHVRAMDGKPNAEFEAQRHNCAKYHKGGSFRDRHGNPVASGSPEAHISQSDYEFLE